MPQHLEGHVTRQIEEMIAIGYHKAGNMTKEEFKQMLTPLAQIAIDAKECGDRSMRVMIVIPDNIVPMKYQFANVNVQEPEQHTAARRYPIEQEISNLGNIIRLSDEAIALQAAEELIEGARDGKDLTQKTLVQQRRKKNAEHSAEHRRLDERLSKIEPYHGKGHVADSDVASLTKDDAKSPYLIFDVLIHSDEAGKSKSMILEQVRMNNRAVLSPIELVAMAREFPYKMSAGQFDFLRNDDAEYFFLHSRGAGAVLTVGPPHFHILRQGFVFATRRA
jgi:hypothetical protein